ncbi:MAG: double-strand break repair helicase AddA [Sphingopyxis sp.]|nr:double-strand break repair helicase AddA [Sphingopyxis sp.]
MADGAGHDILKNLDAAQLAAVDPAAHVWLNASAGTGKTQVLSARVLRLLLLGTSPDAILCITFTKAGAAEMAHRIHERLALWVGCKDEELRTDLQAIGLDGLDRELQAYSRTLFARVIDSPAGAIRVQTIHSFCQSLLASFPFEADVLPGFRLIEGGEAKEARRALLAEMLSDAAEGARRRGWLGQLSRRLGEMAATAFVEKAAANFAGRPEPKLAPAAADLRAALGLPLGDKDDWLVARLNDGHVADADLAALVAAWSDWGTATAVKWLDTVAAWRAADAPKRRSMIADLYQTVMTQKGTLRSDYADGGKRGKLIAVADSADRVGAACSELLRLPAQMALADDLAAGWQLAAQFAGEWSHRKGAEGLAEYDDLIARTAALLANGELSDWIRFKLDQRIDHLLIDEAQDTNADQWTIADGLTGEFFAGLGVRDEARLPSMFTVGDRKQAIFSFQGTDPVAFENARQGFAVRAAAGERPFVPADLTSNFRSAPAVLEFVDRWLADGGVAAMGIAPPVPDHHAFHGANRPGRVELWPPLIVAPKGSEDDSGDEDEGEGSDDSLRAATDPASLKLARALADRIADWTAHGIDGVAVRPDDILVLVRTRRALAARIVAQLQSRGIAVAGIDRFDLAQPLAVQDLLAALRFTVQPDDEYSLAVLLVSPLIGWGQQQLYDETAERGRTPLRQWIAARDTTLCAHANARLALLRAEADYTTPYRLLDAILSGPLQGRRAMAARLGAEANDAIDALLAEALAFEMRQAPSIIGFLDHIERAPVEVKRQTDPRGGLVRVMTVHGSKGLQAPIVILADATGEPNANQLDVKFDIAAWRGLPLFRTSKDDRPDQLEMAWNDARRAQLEEHWRLFYVAATRAERLLVVTGTLRATAKQLPEHCWYRAAEQALLALKAEEIPLPWDDPRGLRLASAPGNWGKRALSPGSKAAALVGGVLPDWAVRPPPEEARPPRPLAPSRLREDDAPQRPVGAGRAAAIRRGTLLHSLIERLPQLAPERRLAAAERWLAAQDAAIAAPERAAMAAEACEVLAHPDWLPLFGPRSLAEAPFSAVIEGGLVVAGTVDRLLVTGDAVLVVDYKTGAQVPARAEDVAPAYLRQMSAYAAALAAIFPGRRVAAALLYTSAPKLIALPAALLAAHKPGLEGAKTNLPDTGLEPEAVNA